MTTPPRDFEQQAREMVLGINTLQSIHSEGPEVLRLARLLRCEAVCRSLDESIPDEGIPARYVDAAREALRGT